MRWRSVDHNRPDLQLALYAEASRRGWTQGEVQLPRIVAGPEAAAELAAMPCDVVLNGITGSTGLSATLAALETRTDPRSGQQGSLVVGGSLVTRPRSRVQLLLSTPSTRPWPNVSGAARHRRSIDDPHRGGSVGWPRTDAW